MSAQLIINYVLVAILLGTFISIAFSVRKFLKQIADIKASDTLNSIKYNEEEIIGHLDYIINEALNTYEILNITPKDIPYINSNMEQEILDYLADEVPGRISNTLYSTLSYIYSNEYIGEFIGTHIYMIVLNYVLNYNQPHV